MVRFGLVFAAGWLGISGAMAQSPEQPALASPTGAAPMAAPPAPLAAQPPEDKRIFGVLPNHRTTSGSLPFHALTAKEKIVIGEKDSFDYPVFITSGLFAALYHLENQNPWFGQGMSGYGQRYAAAYGDQMLGNMMTEGFVPALGHQDPRYFRSGQGTLKGRAWYAVKAIFVARMDSGRNSFNFSEWGGNALAAAISNAYYPDTRTASDNAQKLVIQCATDAFSNVLKEFWPDVKRKLHHEKQ